mgnify:CR=1 FL=1
MDGFFLLNKGKGITSNQLVQKIKKNLSLKKVGHLGTLDPMATAIRNAANFRHFAERACQ